MLWAPETAYRGQQIHETKLKEALRRLDPEIHFDMGASLNIWHPKINRWQGVFRAGTHIGAMGRGALPEFNLYREGRDASGRPERRELLEIGWRTTLANIDRRRLPGLTMARMCLALGVEEKKFVGDWSELNIPEEKVDPLFDTMG